MGPGEKKRRQIIEAAVAEFRELGFAGASMDRVSARAGVSKRTVYNHFESKEALFRAILDLMADELAQALDVTYRPGRPIREQLVALAAAEGRLMTSAHFMNLARMVLAETIRDPGLAAEMNRRLERLSVFNDFMAAAARDGALRIPEVARATQQFLGLIKAQAFWPAIYSGQDVSQEEMARIVETTVDMFLKEYAPAA